MTVLLSTPAQATIETDRLTLRPLRASDAGLIDLHAGDARVANMTTSIPHPLPPGATAALLARARAEDRVEDVWALDGSRRGHAELLGLIGLTRLDRDQSEIGYWIAPAFWKTGYASEAVRALIAGNPHQNTHIFGSVFQDNPASARVLMQAGFDYLGDAEAFSVARNTLVPTWTYSRKLDP
ncbi:GNAT family N-acetyltransferase [Aestuariibius insulae]|uniref:GNAT family N-acetyltransferase n=1 Tax=Aestuariibius insulae TaxID=2058287 RepID=UPI00345E212F